MSEPGNTARTSFNLFQRAAKLVKRFWLTLTLVMLAVVIASKDSWSERLNLRPVLRIGIPAGQPSRYLRDTLNLKKWKPEEHSNAELEVIPLDYDNLFQVASDSSSSFDVVLIDDPWLAQLAEHDRLTPVPANFSIRIKTGTEAKSVDVLPRFAPEFLRVSFYRKKGAAHAPLPPRRPTLASLVRPGETHIDERLLRDVRQTYNLYALPYVGNVQVMVRNVPPSGKDDFDEKLAARTADWSTIEEMFRKNVHFYTRLGSNNSALADYLPMLWSEGGCLVGQDKNGEEISGLRYEKEAPAVKALSRSLHMANRQVQYARFNDEDVYGYLEREQNSIGISWTAFRNRRPFVPRTAEAETPSTMWYLMPQQTKGVKPVAPCDRDEELLSETGEHRAGVLGAWSMAVDNRSRQKERAWEFIAWALADLQAAKKPSAGKCPDSGAIEPVGDDPLQGYPTPFEDQLSCGARMAVRNSKPRLAHPKWFEIERAVGFRIRQAHWRTKTPEQAIRCASQDLHQILTTSNGESNNAVSGSGASAAVGCQ